ncbi:MAG: hypothetical protein CL946_03415 [Ectothiorhodospiraceae bacterium]|nr:hypothetical protein [Ectothiorhodospiraceae bacterium]
MLLLSTSTSYAQLTGEVHEKTKGLRFTVPAGWVGQATPDGYLFGHETTAGLLMVLHHQYSSTGELRSAALEGLMDENNGTSLTVSGEVRTYGDNGIQADFSGTIEWQPADAYAIGLVSPHGGGVTIIGAAASGMFGGAQKQAVETLAASVRFSKPDVADIVAEWKPWLAGYKLTYMNSYNSGYGGGGYSDKEVIDLCADGSFGFESSSTTVVNADGGSGAYSGDQGAGAGTWDLSVSGGSPQLVLRFHNGESLTYTLEYKDKKLYLNGYRYFRTQDAACN